MATLSLHKPLFAPRPWRQLLRHFLAAALPRRCFMVSGPAAANQICLTFDDGPHPVHTPRILDILRSKNATATFFVIGQNAQRHPDLLRRIVAEGHAVGHHTFSHSPPDQTSTDQLLSEIHQTRNLLAKILGHPSNLFRPPLGKLTLPKLGRLLLAHQTIVLWNIDPRDYARHSPDEILTAFDQTPLQGGDLILLHDDRPHTSAALPGIISLARQANLTFTTPLAWL